MGIFFKDEFEGSGSITGHLPEIEIGTGAAWEAKVRATNLVGGYAVNPASYGACNFKYMALDSDDTPGEFTVDFAFVTGSILDLDEVDGYAITLVVYMDKATPFTRVTLNCHADYDIGEWVLDLADDGSITDAEPVTLAPDTEYEGSITVSATGSTATMFGVTVALPGAIPVPGGVNGFEVTIGGGCKLGSLLGKTIGYEPPPPGVGIADLVAPMVELVAGDAPKATAQLVAPMAALRAAGGGAALLLAPSASIEAAGRDSTGDQSFTYTAPVPVLQAFGGAQARLVAPSPALSLTGTVSGQGRAALAPPAALIEADGRVSGTAGAALRAPASRLVGYGGAVCSITVAGATLQARGTSGAIGRAALTLPLFQLTASGSRQNHGRAELLAPAARLGAQAQAWLLAPAARLSAIGTAVVAVSYEAYSVNLSHGDPEAPHEVTHYTQFPFDRIVRYQSSYFGVAADGLYLLEGTTDDGDAIGYAVKTCVDDFKASELKTIDAACFAGRLGAASTVTLLAGETGAATYDFTTPRGPAAQNHRQRFGKGVKSRYFALALAGDDSFELDAIELDVRKLKRRI